MTDERPPVPYDVYESNVRRMASSAYYMGATFAMAACVAISMLAAVEAHWLWMLAPPAFVVAAGILAGRNAA